VQAHDRDVERITIERRKPIVSGQDVPGFHNQLALGLVCFIIQQQVAGIVAIGPAEYRNPVVVGVEPGLSPPILFGFGLFGGNLFRVLEIPDRGLGRRQPGQHVLVGDGFQIECDFSCDQFCCHPPSFSPFVFFGYFLS
jgi:hypothetical protein